MSNKNEEKGYSKKEEWLLGTIDKVLSINNSSQYHKHLLDFNKNCIIPILGEDK